jgi:hypothetical protein
MWFKHFCGLRTSNFVENLEKQNGEQKRAKITKLFYNGARGDGCRFAFFVTYFVHNAAATVSYEQK